MDKYYAQATVGYLTDILSEVSEIIEKRENDPSWRVRDKMSETTDKIEELLEIVRKNC